MKPLYWPRHNHELVEQAFTQRLHELNLSRRQWQVLNAVARGAGTAEEVDEAMKPFVAGEGTMAPHLEEFARRGRLRRNQLT
ncbi:hypothetical protein [Amycolatopsis sp. FDAARGOS 1241]|uniref:hypothetical protein n=1 Tax=Amycolatopsis sp. FDAARGOS 1241 TaxID=2778070 RepID=UPI001EF1AC1A|nr:hypothetical protein [Amycolatopsis sp. FDAARGOS 1241]